MDKSAEKPKWPEGMQWVGLVPTKVSLGYNKHRQRVVLLERGEQKIHEVIVGTNLLDPQRAELFDRLHARLLAALDPLAVEQAITYFTAGIQDMYAVQRVRLEHAEWQAKQ